MKRRNFIATTTAAAVGTNILGGVRLKAFNPDHLMNIQADDDRILIVIQMFGGNDGLNTIIPVDASEYYDFRPNIAVKKSSAVNVLSQIYMHPALDTPKYPSAYNLRRMMEDGRLAIVQGVGYENPNLSHFRSTDIWLSGFNTSDPEARLVNGWLGRFWSEKIQGFPQSLPAHPTAVQIGGSLSMLLRSPKGDVGIALTDPNKFFELGQGLSPDLDPMPEDTRYGREFNFVRLVAEQSDLYSSVVKQAYDAGRNMISYPDNAFVRQMQLVARLISGGLKSKVFLVYMNGFDTHVQQQNSDESGLHPYLLESLSAGVGAFMQDALQQGFADRVVGMTVSEFGRRPFENGSNGTDHGASSVQFVWGNKVRAGVYGTTPDLVNLNSNGDLRYQWDFRRVYADVMEYWFGGTPEETETVLQERVLPLGVLQRPTSVDDAFSGRFRVGIKAFPNPFSTSTTLEWMQESPASVTIDLYSTAGRFVETIYAGSVQPGLVRIPIVPSASGAYICNVSVNGINNPVSLQCLR
ncbi:MAG: DUF1501 domain-containing protein [Ignavibacteria bacterium]|nr:DUF1501 domain-containing protein [Ignavibacteria bacterium]